MRAMRAGRCSSRPATKCMASGDISPRLVCEGTRFVPLLSWRLRWRCVPLPGGRDEGGMTVLLMM